MLNRTRTSTLDAFGLRDQRNRIYPALTGSDGSTLSLDFTSMSGLDSRFTFSRSSPATFINSSGLVRYADHNLWFNTAYSGLSGANPSLTSSGWQYVFAGAGRTATFNGDGSVTISTSSGTDRLGLARATSISNTTLNLVVSVDIVADNSATYGTLTASDLVTEGSVTEVAFYINGVSVAGSTVITGPCNLTWVIQKTGGGTVTPNFGVNLRQARSGAFTIRFANPRFGYWSGAAPFPYLANTSTSVERHDARFDYDPTTLAPRGLLIEGSVTNLATRSEEIMNGVGNWIVGQNTTNTQNTMDLLDPAGTNKATKVVCNANAYCSLAQAISVSGNTQYTFSYWIRGTAGSDNRIYSYAGAGAIGELTARSAYSYSTTGWTRVQVTFTTNAGTTAIYVYAISKQTAPATSDTLYVWGAQLEASSAASSYIPTGTSTVQRAADSCDITGTNFSSWWPANQSEFTVLWTGDITRSPATSQFLWLTRNSGGTSRSRGYVTTGSVIRANAVALYDFTASPATNATVNTVFKNALAVRSGDSAMYVNNGTTIGSETTTTALGSGFDADKITFNPNADNFMHIRTLKFWPQRLPNATLNGLVT